MKNNKFVAVLACIALLSSCGQPDANTTKKEDILTANRDTTVNPAEDFFAYANGGWIKNNSIPSDETSYGIGELVEKELRTRLLAINDDALKKAEKTGAAQQIGDFWYSALDTNTIEADGFGPLKAELSKIAAITTKAGIMEQAIHMHSYGANVFFDEGVSQDPKNSSVQTFLLYQGGLGMPNRDYYFNIDERTAGIRKQYPHYISRTFQLLGYDELTSNLKAATIMALETRLAKASRKLEDLRNPYANYNKFAITKLTGIGSNIAWPALLQQIGVHDIDSVIVGQPEFYTTLDKELNSSELQVLKDYMTFHLVSTYSPYLSKGFVNAHFDFYSRTIRGAKEQKTRQRRALDAEQGAIGEALGQLFVKEYFNATAKKRYDTLVENVRNAYKARIEKLDWMTPATKEKAVKKLFAIKKKIGYPEVWKDFSTLKIDRGHYALNMMRANQWWKKYEMDKLGKPVDRNEWHMTPQTYNAYYNESNNEIVLPAAMMTVPGYRDEELDDALVYGYTAASTVGHEITHGFDDQGRQFDENGNLRSWWTDSDTAEFMKRAEVLVNQFSSYKPLDTTHINGKATLGENLADLGGILIGLDAFKLTATYKKGEKIHGMTPLQRFFHGYALGWLVQQRPERLATLLLTDVHAPAKYRVNGPFRNVADFYEAFGVKPSDKMYLADSLRVKLW